MLQFNNITEIIKSQETVSRSQFTRYGSKKQLFEAEILTETQTKHFTDLKGACCFDLHADEKYMVVTMWASATKTVSFLVVNMWTMQAAQVDTIKNAKKAVIDLVTAEAEVDEAEVAAALDEAEVDENEVDENEVDEVLQVLTTK